MIHFAIVNQDGEIEGEHAQIYASSNPNKFEGIEVPGGYRKVLLTFEEYDELSLDFDHEKLVHNTVVNLSADEEEYKVRKMTEAEKQTVLDKRPEWYRDTKMPDGRIKREKKDGTLLEVAEDGKEEVWEDVKIRAK
jgi:hypothetical protein